MRRRQMRRRIFPGSNSQVKLQSWAPTLIAGRKVIAFLGSLVVELMRNT